LDPNSFGKNIGCFSVVDFEFVFFIYRYMKVEAETEDDDGTWYKSMTLEFLDGVRKEDEHLYNIYRRQDGLVKSLRELYRHISERGRNNRLDMQDILQKEIASGKFSQLKAFDPLPFPLNPAIEVCYVFLFVLVVFSFMFSKHVLFQNTQKQQVKGMIPSRCLVFKSAQKPLGLCFERVDGSAYMVLFKLGDDLRCDQLVLQIISLMDEMLQRDGNLDLCLSPYRVLATGKNDGMVEIVPDSVSVAACLKNNDNDIAAYFKKLHPSDAGPFGIDAKVLDNFVRSCAGYGVIT
jgi:hypothetical protein